MYEVFDKPTLSELTHFGVKGMRWGKRSAHRTETRELKRRIKSQKKETKQNEKNKKIEERNQKEKDRLEKKLYDQTPEGKKAREAAFEQKLERAAKAIDKAIDYMGSDEVAIYNEIRKTNPKLAERYMQEQEKYNPNAFKIR